jgi:4'-phosphopantetheinyl transferase
VIRRIRPMPFPSHTQVHVWPVNLDAGDSVVQDMTRLLSNAERRRMNALVFRRDARRFAVAHGLLRVLLGRCLGTSPGGLRFAHTRFGRPYLKTHPRFSLYFSMTHCAGKGLIAIARRPRIGIDLEQLVPRSSTDALARRCLSGREWSHYQSLPEGQRASWLIRAWVCKEAFAKATGRGLNLEFRDVEVCVSKRPPALVSIRGGESQVSRWTLVQFRPWKNYVAALATRWPEARVTMMPYTRH